MYMKFSTPLLNPACSSIVFTHDHSYHVLHLRIQENESERVDCLVNLHVQEQIK